MSLDNYRDTALHYTWSLKVKPYINYDHDLLIRYTTYITTLLPRGI